jgi:hypothetical protein
MLHPKKVGTLPVDGSDKEKQTNEIKIAKPLLDPIDIKGKSLQQMHYSLNVILHITLFMSGKQIITLR